MKEHNVAGNSSSALFAWAIGLLLVSVWLLSAHAEERLYYGSVIRITDGEKLLVRTRNRTFRVRLAGLHSPRPDQPSGKEAMRALARLVHGRKVRLVQVDELRDGWMTAQVYLGAMHINAELVRQGYAWADRDEAGNSPLAGLEQEAREARRGLWAQPAPLPLRESPSVGRGENSQ